MCLAVFSVIFNSKYSKVFALKLKKEHDHQRVFSSATRHTKSELMVNRKLPVDH